MSVKNKIYYTGAGLIGGIAGGSIPSGVNQYMNRLGTAKETLYRESTNVFGMVKDNMEEIHDTAGNLENKLHLIEGKEGFLNKVGEILKPTKEILEHQYGILVDTITGYDLALPLDNSDSLQWVTYGVATGLVLAAGRKLYNKLSKPSKSK